MLKSAFVLALLGSVCVAQLNLGSDGSDGALVWANSDAGTAWDDLNSSIMTINLANAVSAPWQTPSSGVAQNGPGVYDSLQWAVVFKYTTVTIPAGRYVRFVNKLAGQYLPAPPIVWLATGAVNIDGYVQVHGENPTGQVYPLGGPGGFRGGIGFGGASTPASAGYGPGGALVPSNSYPSGSYATKGTYGTGPTYGSANIFPLIGGSGGGGDLDEGYPGGGGGGAILIGSNGSVAINGTGQVTANGGGYSGQHSGGGSGGAIRIIGNQVTIGSGCYVQAVGWSSTNSGNGRIRIEGNGSGSLSLNAQPQPSASLSLIPGPVFPGSTAPRIWVASVTNASSQVFAVPTDPKSSFLSTDADLQLTGVPGPVTVTIEGVNIPADGQGNYPAPKVRVTFTRGNATEFQAPAFVDNGGIFSTSIQVTLADGVSTIQARCALP